MQNDNCLTFGPSGTGKTTRVLRDILDAAERGYAIVTLDPHTGPGSLSFQSLAHLAARGYEHRVLYERLSDFTHPVLPYDFLPASQVVPRRAASGAGKVDSRIPYICHMNDHAHCSVPHYHSNRTTLRRRIS